MKGFFIKMKGRLFRSRLPATISLCLRNLFFHHKATTIELKSSRVPMISQPEKVTNFILSAAKVLNSERVMSDEIHN